MWSYLSISNSIKDHDIDNHASLPSLVFIGINYAKLNFRNDLSHLETPVFLWIHSDFPINRWIGSAIHHFCKTYPHGYDVSFIFSQLLLPIGHLTACLWKSSLLARCMIHLTVLSIIIMPAIQISIFVPSIFCGSGYYNTMLDFWG